MLIQTSKRHHRPPPPRTMPTTHPAVPTINLLLLLLLLLLIPLVGDPHEPPLPEPAEEGKVPVRPDLFPVLLRYGAP